MMHAEAASPDPLVIEIIATRLSSGSVALRAINQLRGHGRRYPSTVIPGSFGTRGNLGRTAEVSVLHGVGDGAFSVVSRRFNDPL
ncbi:MAG: hypothetical protein NDI90_02505 [Nitrospira sp. BO4]|nr:hypothetical protein [Nitrospira sp. BO4]